MTITFPTHTPMQKINGEEKAEKVSVFCEYSLLGLAGPAYFKGHKI